jgi:hypothetical protein
MILKEPQLCAYRCKASQEAHLIVPVSGTRICTGVIKSYILQKDIVNVIYYRTRNEISNLIVPV